MAACALAMLAIAGLVFSHGEGAFASSSDRNLLLVITSGALLAAGLSLNVLRTGQSLAPVHSARGAIAETIWAAALGDSAASVAFDEARNRLREAVAVLPDLPPEQRAAVRGTYSYTLEALDQILLDLQSTWVVSTDGLAATKDTVVTRLETASALWDADFSWFERVEARLPA